MQNSLSFTSLFCAFKALTKSPYLTYDLVMHDQVIHSLLYPFAFVNFVFATNVHSPFMGTNCVHPPVMLYWSGKSLGSRSN
jgi:hypothetical protein